MAPSPRLSLTARRLASISSRKLVAYLLSACPDLVILATSRRPMRLPQERLYPLAPLATPPPDAASYDDISSNESVKLFVARARERTQDWELTPERAPYVARICRELDGIPLAIEVAAPRLGVLTVEAIAAQSDDLLAALGNKPTGDLRTWTLRAALLWSYKLLKPVEQRFDTDTVQKSFQPKRTSRPSARPKPR